jgi:hypothetical protein
LISQTKLKCDTALPDPSGTVHEPPLEYLVAIQKGLKRAKFVPTVEERNLLSSIEEPRAVIDLEQLEDEFRLGVEW